MPVIRRRYQEASVFTATRATRRRRGGCAWRMLALALIVLMALIVIVALTPIPGWVKDRLVSIAREIHEPEIIEREVVREVIREVPVEAEPQPEPEPPVTPHIPRQEISVANMFNGVRVETEFNTLDGDLATIEREDPESFLASFELSVRVPKPNTSLDELSAINPHLPKLLPDLDRMVETSNVSDYYHKLYENKLNRIQGSLARLDRVLDRHNFFDLETILELTHPETGATALLIQSEMDTCSDGSDGDRMPELDDYISMSSNYQPFTSYGWRKTTGKPNPLLKRFEKRLKELEKEFAIPGLSIKRNRELRAGIAYHKRAVADLKRRSFLVAEKDPYMVVSLAMLGEHNDSDHAPKIGDYGAIIHGDHIYPCIVGDAGPTFKVGEASLRVARQLNENASPYSRPVSDLTITYLVFTGSDEGRSQPDLDRWHQRVESLLGELGGLGEPYHLHRWSDPFAEEASDEAAEPGDDGQGAE